MDKFNLRDWRKANGFTQEQLAKRFDISRWTVARLETDMDKTGMAPGWVRLACRALERDER